MTQAVRKRRVRVKIRGRSDRARLSVFRSHRYLWAQIIDDEKGVTLVAASDADLKAERKPATQKVQKEIKGTKTQKARLIGKILAEKALKLNIKKVVFDRGPYQYHGRIKALAQGARKGGLIF